MEPPPVPTLLAQLSSFATNLESALTAPGVDWQCCPGETEWSLTEVACHLRDVEREVHQPRFQALIEAPDAFIPGAVADEWVEERRYREQHGPDALADFLSARAETVALLTGLDEAIWQRHGQHAFLGPTTMHELLHLAVQHDQAHWEQVVGLLQLPGA